MTPLSDGPAHEPEAVPSGPSGPPGPPVPSAPSRAGSASVGPDAVGPAEDGPAEDAAADAAASEEDEAATPVPLQLPLVPDGERRYPSTIGGAFYLVVLVVTVIALVTVGLGHWRGGVHVLAGAMVASSVARAFLPHRDLGMLEVRSRWFDVALLGAVGVALWVLASTIPDQG